MQKFQSVLLDVWREACKHIGIMESVKAITPMLRKDLPMDRLLVRQVDHERSFVETIVESLADGQRIEPLPRAECSGSTLKKLVAWCRKGQVGHWRADARWDDLVSALVPAGVECDVLAGPLAGSGDCHGVLLLVAGEKESFNGRHRTLMEALLDPFSVALRNDARIREMAALRDAAEADNRSLLAHMGRERLGDTIVGSQSGLSEVMDRVDLVARSDAPVLVFGETGSGKELIARAIHDRSVRSNGAFIRVNCGAIPPELIDSQLFGHEKGAFTGATGRHRGWFERADGGSLLLDEVAERPAAAQVRLLRILQDGWLERVGGLEPIHVNVRIVAATHRDLAGMVAEGKFREDLWYRLAVFPIVLPPLRHRRQDIPELARHFARRAAKRFGLVEVMPTDEDIAMMVSYDWPGNVRELAAVLDRATILGNGLRLEVGKALGLAGSLPFRQKAKPAEAPGPDHEVLSLEKAMRRHIEAMLVRTRGRIEGRDGAAALLDINPNTLRARMRKLNVDWKRFR
jgi:hydrogenase-4 transcriptional activator